MVWLFVRAESPSSLPLAQPPPNADTHLTDIPFCVSSHEHFCGALEGIPELGLDTSEKVLILLGTSSPAYNIGAKGGSCSRENGHETSH